MRKKILVVDDETDFTDIMKVRLEANNYDVIVAHDGEEALAKIKDHKPDAVLLDILMPKLDGLGALKRIRKEDKNLPVFIITAFSSEKRFNMANKLNASGFIVKTGDLQKEVDNITAALNISDKYRPKK